jgi:hypothetical protein
MEVADYGRDAREVDRPSEPKRARDEQVRFLWRTQSPLTRRTFDEHHGLLVSDVGVVRLRLPTDLSGCKGRKERLGAEEVYVDDDRPSRLAVNPLTQDSTSGQPSSCGCGQELDVCTGAHCARCG